MVGGARVGLGSIDELRPSNAAVRGMPDVVATEGQPEVSGFSEVDVGDSAAGAVAVDRYTPRILPYHPNAYVPLETPEILWQR